MSDQPIKNVAIIGAAGHSGSYMVTELLKTQKHKVTAITRDNSPNTLPAGVAVKKVNYDDSDTVVEALKGQDVLIITLSVSAPRDLQQRLVEAAIKAGVPWVMPNHWAPDTEHEGLAADVGIFGGLKGFQTWLDSQTQIKHLSLACGFWYEWSLAIPDSYGFDFDKKTVTFFDDGETKISTSTWPQVGRAVASLLSLPSAELEKLRKNLIYVSSFTLNQQDMFDSVLRVTGDKKEDWTITKQPVEERFENGIAAMKQGSGQGFIHAMYTRVFYPDGNGDYEASRGTANSLLGLPKEDLDEATAAAIKRAKDSPFTGRH